MSATVYGGSGASKRERCRYSSFLAPLGRWECWHQLLVGYICFCHREPAREVSTLLCGTDIAWPLATEECSLAPFYIHELMGVSCDIFCTMWVHTHMLRILYYSRVYRIPTAFRGETADHVSSGTDRKRKKNVEGDEKRRMCYSNPSPVMCSSTADRKTPVGIAFYHGRPQHAGEMAERMGRGAQWIFLVATFVEREGVRDNFPHQERCVFIL